jgi:hypothetical protein
MVVHMRAFLCLIGTMLVVCAAASAQAQQAGLQPDGRLVVTAAANEDIRRYVEQVSNRYGALAVSQDGSLAASYVCRSRLWKNCDDAGSEDSNIAIPSGRVARDEALTLCRARSGAACILLFINGDQQREFGIQP